MNKTHVPVCDLKKTVADLATYENANQPAVGVQAVLVNGTLVVGDGELKIDADSGQPIRRKLER
ncbi:hypothetical protein NBRC116589_18820 [Ruegeria sp. HU-ET01832]